MVVGVCDASQPERLSVHSLRAKLKKSLDLRTLWRWYSYEKLLEPLAQDLEHMMAKLGPFIQAENTVVGPRHVALHWCRPTPLFVKNVPA